MEYIALDYKDFYNKYKEVLNYDFKIFTFKKVDDEVLEVDGKEYKINYAKDIKEIYNSKESNIILINENITQYQYNYLKLNLKKSDKDLFFITNDKILYDLLNLFKANEEIINKPLFINENWCK